MLGETEALSVYLSLSATHTPGSLWEEIQAHEDMTLLQSLGSRMDGK